MIENKITEETLALLNEAFERGASDEEACAYSEIEIEDLEKIEEENISFKKKKEKIRHKLILGAKSLIIQQMINQKDPIMAVKYLEILRKEKEEKKNTKKIRKSYF